MLKMNDEAERELSTTLEHMVAKARDAASGGLNALSTSEKIAAALILNRPDWLQELNFSFGEALERLGTKWTALIPAAEKIILETDATLIEAGQRAKAETFFAGSTGDEVLEFNAKLVTVGNAPGYRSIPLYFDISALGSAKKTRVGLNIDEPKDGEQIASHIADVHKTAWSRELPRLDVKPSEKRPAWVVDGLMEVGKK
jgi:hypothetical protein